MGHAHSHLHTHDHSHGIAAGQSDSRHGSRSRLAITLSVTTMYMIAEVVAGLWTNSLALLADAGHMLSDCAALGLSLFAIRMTERGATNERTFGFYRTEILAALANGAALVVIAVFIAVEAIERLGTPAPVMGMPMLLVACGGLVMNLFAIGLLHPHRNGSLNVRGAFLHVLTDALGSVGAIGAGLLIWTRGWYWADPAASLVIAALVVYSAWTLLRDAVAVLMEGTPEGVDVSALRQALEALPAVLEVHDLHVWLITSDMPSASVHLVTREGADRDLVLHQARELLCERYGVTHTTIQVERAGSVLGGSCPGCPAQ